MKVLVVLAVLVSSLSVCASTNQVCKVCRGKKSVEQWVSCEKCGGSGIEYSGSRQVRCSVCGRSVKKGKVRKVVSCPECSSQPKSGPSYAPRGYNRTIYRAFRQSIGVP